MKHKHKMDISFFFWAEDFTFWWISVPRISRILFQTKAKSQLRSTTFESKYHFWAYYLIPKEAKEEIQPEH